MWTFTTIRDQAARSGQGATRLFSVVQSQPSWITRVALTTAVLVFTGVVLLLVVPALLIAAAVFLVLALAAMAVRTVRRLLGLDGAGRRNVRVIVRRE